MTLFASPSSTMSESLGRSRSPGRRTYRELDTTTFGYESPPDTAALSREVFKWVQGLDLSHALKNVRRDTANGFLIAEVFSRYFPADIQMHGFANGVSSHYKKDNWVQLQQFSQRQGIDLPADLVDGTMQGVHGAAVALLEHLYELFTGKKVKRMSLSPSATMDASSTGTGLAGLGETTKEAGARTIATTLKQAANIEFGEVETRAVGDAVELRKRLAGGGGQ